MRVGPPAAVGFGASGVFAGLALLTWPLLVATGVLDVRVGPSLPAFLPVALAFSAAPAGLVLTALGLQLALRGPRSL